MEPNPKFPDPLTVFLGVVGASLVYGLIVPTIYFLSESNSGYSVEAMEQAAVLVAVVTTTAVMASWWFQRSAREPQRIWQFGVRELLLVTFVTAIVLGVGSRLRMPSVRSWLAVSIGMVAIVTALWWRYLPRASGTTEVEGGFRFGVKQLLVATAVIAMGLSIALYLGEKSIAGRLVALWHTAMMAVAMVFFDSRAKWRFATWIGVMVLPFWWVVAYNRPFGPVSGMIGALPIGSGLFSAFLTRQVFDVGGPDQLFVIAAVFASLIAAMGMWAARKGGWLYTVLLVLLLLQCGFASLVFYALYRA